MLQNLLGPLLENVQEFGAEVQARFPASWVLDTLSSALLKHLFERAIAAGVPDGFAEKFSLTPEQAKQIYSATLEAALTRI